MSKFRSSPKKEYLLGKMFDGAVVMYDFFERAQDDESVDFDTLASDLKSEYRLTDSQGEYLDGVAGRAVKARGIVRYLGRRFGIDSDSNFENPRGLYDLLLGDKPPKEIGAKSFNFGIGFIHGTWKSSDPMGYKYNLIDVNDCFNAPLKKTVSWLERNTYTNCRTLTFSVPGDYRMAQYAEARRDNMSTEEKLVATVFGDPNITTDGVRDEVIRHELRHVINGIIGGQMHSYDFFRETSAHLYDGGIAYGIHEDFEREKRLGRARLENVEAGIKKILEEGRSDAIVRNQERLVASKEKYLEKLEEDSSRQYELFGAFVKNGLPVGFDLKGRPKKPVLSYLFSMMPDRDVAEKRIGEIVTHC